MPQLLSCPANPYTLGVRSSFSFISRAVFLAVSWTWVIGMFLPVLLIKDFGVWSFLPFAIANVLGAMSVGLVLCSRKAKKAYASDTGARVVFSIATIAFQVFFLAALAGAHLPGILAGLPMAGEASEPVDVSSAEASAIVVLLLLMIPFALARKERPEWFGGAAALVVFGISIACAALAYFTTSGDAYAVPALNGEFGLGAMAFASSGIVFGFALCPYLDQSIVRIRSITPGARGRAVSILGFGVFFLSMIFFTLAYSQAMLGRAALSTYFLLHILVQAMFTVGVHMGELRRLSENHERVRGAALFWIAFIACAGSAAVGVFSILEDSYVIDSRDFVFVYRGYLSLYGIAFPLYVWAVMVPVRGLSGCSRAVRMRSFWVTLVICSAPFGYGYLAHEWWLIGAGVAIALAGPFLLCRLLTRQSFSRAETGDFE